MALERTDDDPITDWGDVKIAVMDGDRRLLLRIGGEALDDVDRTVHSGSRAKIHAALDHWSEIMEIAERKLATGDFETENVIAVETADLAPRRQGPAP